MVQGVLNRLLWVLILENEDMHSHSFERRHVPFTLVYFTFIPSWTNSSKKLPHVRASKFQNPLNFCVWNLESAPEIFSCGIQNLINDLLTHLLNGLFPNWCILKYLRRTILQSSFYIILFKSVRAYPHLRSNLFWQFFFHHKRLKNEDGLSRSLTNFVPDGRIFKGAADKICPGKKLDKIE